MTTPAWALTLSYWLHMLATVVWVGGLSALALLVLPAAERALDSKAYASLVDRVQKRLDPLGWFCLILLGLTGLLQMGANPNYNGFLAINNRWAIAILSKHILILIMVAISAFLTWIVLPDLRRSALLLSQGREAPEAARLQQRNRRLLAINLILAIAVLALTAVARAS